MKIINIKEKLKYPLVDNVTGEKSYNKTYIKIEEIDKNLKFSFEVYTDRVNPVRTRYNSKIYEEEVVEVFISSKLNPKKYLEFEVSPNNTQFCALIKNNYKKARCLKYYKNCLFNSFVEKTSYGFNVEIILPIKTVLNKLNVQDKNSLEFNVYRIDRPKNCEWKLSALNPTYKENFHIRNSFLKLNF